MEKYFKKISSLEIGSQNNPSTSTNKRSYHPNDRDKVRCAYLQKGPCQPMTHDFSQTVCASSFRRFNPNWFDDYGNWLEYKIGRAFKNARGNLKLIAPSIQKDIVRAAARETKKVIVDDLGDELFAVLVDEACDISIKEQMSVCLRYVNKEGQVREYFLGLVHVSNTNALFLKLALESLLETYNLSLSRVCGQGYDGASNMQGDFNGLKILILKENSYAFYVHCFDHQLQLALVTVAKKTSCKRRDMLHDSWMTKTIEALKSGEIFSGRGLNQEIALKRVGDTRWDSHYGTILRLIFLFPSMVNVLKYLSQALQKNDQDTVNAMALVKVSKQRMQNIRDDGWSLLLDEVSLFFEIFYQVNTELLLCIACLNSRHSFFTFDKEKLIQLAQFYPLEFSFTQLLPLDSQLENFILNLVLVLPVATASVERTFSAMNIIKSRLCNCMGDQFLNDCLVTYIERETFDRIDNEKIIQFF
ncbi:hypothetical protein AAHE18_12G037600 [Arachis hypogaea]